MGHDFRASQCPYRFSSDALDQLCPWRKAGSTYGWLNWLNQWQCKLGFLFEFMEVGDKVKLGTVPTMAAEGKRGLRITCGIAWLFSSPHGLTASYLFMLTTSQCPLSIHMADLYLDNLFSPSVHQLHGLPVTFPCTYLVSIPCMRPLQPCHTLPALYSAPLRIEGKGESKKWDAIRWGHVNTLP